MADQPYPSVPQQPSFPALEAQVIEFWEADGTFAASVAERPARLPDGTQNEFVFYDGPPFANGLPHYGHLLTGFVKDAIPRYQTMRGKRVERRFGWDCHGLPAEMEAEKTLGVSGRRQILDFGIDRFNAFCAGLVNNVAGDWTTYVRRSARWVDMEHDYKTMDLDFMESVMWAFKQLWDKGLIYEGERVLAYDWVSETPLSNFETRLDDAYRDRDDPALTVMFELETGEELLAWTTTPWTLPSNLALAVGPDITYAEFTEDGKRYLLAEARVGAYEKELAGATRTGTVLGADLVGRRYRPLFDFFADRAEQGAFRVLAADFVTTEDGTGVVHIAPAFGEDDFALGAAHGIGLVNPVDERGRFTDSVGPYAGMQVFDANPQIARDLKAAGRVVRHDTYRHAYPHSWRTDAPLIYRAQSSFFVKVTAIKDRMVELNEQIDWTPAHVKHGSFGKWLEGARDWSISRNRYWGSPIPVWKSDDPRYPRVDVYGSLDELERDFGVRPTDLHRPAIDQLTRPNPDDPTGRSTMRRVEDVLDCWFESGSMPFAQVHYPFENREWFEEHFPADFIVEYVGQTRAWFYTLHVLGTALFDRPPFRSCIAHGVLLGNDGQKLSKRLKNFPDPIEVFDTLGSDAMRWALLSSAAVRGADMVADRRPMEEAVRQVLLPLWNSWYFFTLYANTEGRRATPRSTSAHVLDRYVLAKTAELADVVGAAFDDYDLFAACAAVRTYLDALTNWYVRRSRDRFWEGDADAFDTLACVLDVVCRTCAPLLPLLTESIWRPLTGGRSVHLARWPAGELPHDPELVRAMDRVRDVCSAAASVRKARGLRTRLPLASLTVAADWADDLAPFVELIADEVNVKEVVLTTDVGAHGAFELAVVPAVLGPRVGKEVQAIISAVKAGEWMRDVDQRVMVRGRRLADDEYTLRLVPADEQRSAALPANAGLVVLDVDVTPELAAEGLVRDLVRQVNQLRREHGLHVSDRIHLAVDTGHHADVAAAIEAHRSFLMDETLATALELRPSIADSHRVELPDGRAVHVAVVRA